ncbi:DNA starvation/stationary phase protection protein [bacterium]|nr:DNA starvation/stationary phase protection protein [bacterium]
MREYNQTNSREAKKDAERSTLTGMESSQSERTGQKEMSDETLEVMNHILANQFTLFTKTLNYHWNVTGPRFFSLHQFFENQYRELLELMDGVAERVRMMGESPVSTLREMRSDNTIIETPGKFLSADKMINDLHAGHEEIQRQIQEALRMEGMDPGTEDLLVSALRQHQKIGWALKSHLS